MLMPILKKIKSKKRLTKNKKGSMAIEIAIGIFIFVIVLAVLVDLITLGWKFQVIGQTNSFVTRTAALQGGIQAETPEGYPGGNQQYLTLKEVNKIINDSFARANINNGDYSVIVNNRNITSGNGTANIDYKEPVEVDIKINYKWNFMSNITPGAEFEHKIQSSRSALSEYKYRYDDWIGE